MNTAVVGIGSNIHPYRNIALALDMLSEDHHMLRVSELVQTKPIGFTQQADFVNGACMIETTCSADDFTACLKAIENRLGRKRIANKNGPRTIDLDIVMWNGNIINDDYYSREFVRNAVTGLLSASSEI